MNNVNLQHHGVLGQRWGVRRTPAQLGRSGNRSSSGKPAEKSHDDYKKAHSEKSVKAMSDVELRSRLNRLQMEQQYSKLSSSQVSRGRQYLDKAIKAGTTVATVTSTALTVYNNIDKIRGIVNQTHS